MIQDRGKALPFLTHLSRSIFLGTSMGSVSLWGEKNSKKNTMIE